MTDWVVIISGEDKVDPLTASVTRRVIVNGNLTKKEAEDAVADTYGKQPLRSLTKPYIQKGRL